jgi:tetratricopeptide (TPR) repeat protein
VRKKLALLFLLIISTLVVLAQQEFIDSAKKLSNNGEYNQALNIYRNLSRVKPDNSLYYIDYLKTLIKVKNFTEAERLINEKLKVHPNQINLIMDLGYLFEQSGNQEKAEKIYQKILENLTSDESNINLIATEFNNHNNYEYALKTYLRARKMMHNNSAFSLEIINIYRVTKNKTAIITEILSLLKSNHKFIAFAKNNLSEILENSNDYNLLKINLLKALQKQPNNFALADLLVWQYLQQNDFISALDQTIDLDKKNQQDGNTVFSLAEFLIQNKDYQNANKAYKYLISKGEKNNPYYINSLISSLHNKKMMLMENKLSDVDLLSLENDYKSILTQYGQNSQILFALTELADLQSYYLNNPIGGQKLLQDALQLNSISKKQLAEIKLQLGNLYLTNNNVWDATLMYGQVEKTFKNESIGQEAKFRSAKLSFYNGDFKWAENQLDILKASTSQLIAYDALDLSLIIQESLAKDSTGKELKIYASADRLFMANNLEKSLSTLDSLNILYPKSNLGDDAIILRAKILIFQNKYQAAALQYQSILNNKNVSIYRDDALFLLAQLQEQKLNLPKEAKKNYETLLINFPGSPFVTKSRERFRILRGDVL